MAKALLEDGIASSQEIDISVARLMVSGAEPMDFAGYLK